MTASLHAQPARAPSILSRFVRWIIFRIWRFQGWRIAGEPPAGLKKFVIAGAPHTSNWDFVFFAGATQELGIQPNFMGKHTLFKGFMRNFMFDMGGISIDRTKRANAVEQVAAEFERRDELALVIAVEGTRSSDGTWRSGFYNIAQAANVPIVPAWVCNADKVLGFGPAIAPSGNYGEDLARIAQFMLSKRPGYPRYEVLEAQARRLIEEGEGDA